MEPVVNGLEEKYGDKISFQRWDARSDQGSVLFRSYRLLGHPAFVLLDPNGKLVWSGLGERPVTELETAILGILQER